MKPLIPVAAEGLSRVPDLAALDLLNQPPPSIPCGAFAREAALGRLRAVAAAVYEPPPDGVGGVVGVHAAAASVTGGVRSPRGWRDLGDRLVKGARRVF